MSTSFDDIHDLTLISLEDYNLNNLYDASPTSFNSFLDGLLLKSIPYFTNSQKDLSDYNLTTRVFNQNLTIEEKSILSNLELMTWLDKKIYDVRQINLSLTDTDFHHYSEQQNLKGKVEAQNILREKTNQQMVDYGLKNIPWTDWSNGIFFS